VAVDTPQVQRKVNKWTFIIATLIGSGTYLFGLKNFTFGLGFGVLLCVINYRVISKILDIAFRMTSPDLARVLSFVSYHVRFWIIVIILYLVIPKTHYLFVVGAFVGILLPKIVMGVIVVLHTDDEWWTREVEKDEPAVEGISKRRDEGLRFPGLDYDERFKEDPAFKQSNGDLKL